MAMQRRCRLVPSLCIAFLPEMERELAWGGVQCAFPAAVQNLNVVCTSQTCSQLSSGALSLSLHSPYNSMEKVFTKCNKDSDSGVF